LKEPQHAYSPIPPSFELRWIRPNNEQIQVFVVWGKGFKTTHFPLTLCFIKANESVISHEIYMAKTNMVRLIVKA